LGQEIPASGMGNGCRGFALEKLTPTLEPTGTVYHVLVHADGSGTCDCLGGLQHGRCKHREGLAELCRDGKLPYRSVGEFAANDPIAFDRHMASLSGFGGEPGDEIADLFA
jgi:hypothetical protein